MSIRGGQILGERAVKNGLQNNAASRARRIFFVCTPTCDILDVRYVTANEVNTNEFVGGKKAV